MQMIQKVRETWCIKTKFIGNTRHEKTSKWRQDTSQHNTTKQREAKTKQGKMSEKTMARERTTDTNRRSQGKKRQQKIWQDKKKQDQKRLTIQGEGLNNESREGWGCANGEERHETTRQTRSDMWTAKRDARRRDRRGVTEEREGEGVRETREYVTRGSFLTRRKERTKKKDTPFFFLRTRRKILARDGKSYNIKPKRKTRQAKSWLTKKTRVRSHHLDVVFTTIGYEIPSFLVFLGILSNEK